MPRNRSAGRPAPARPSAPSRAPVPQQRRPATTMAAPPQQHAPNKAASPAAQAPGGSGLLGQVASTAAGVAIGSAMGNALGGFFGGSPAEAAPQEAAQQNMQQQQQWSNNCQGITQQFTKCMDDNGGNMQICNWYLEQLKACQAANHP